MKHTESSTFEEVSLVGVNDENLNTVLLPGENVEYVYYVPLKNYFKNPVFWLVCFASVACVIVFLVEPLAIGATTRTIVGLLSFVLLPLPLVYFTYPGKTIYAVTNLRAIILSSFWGKVTAKFSFFACVDCVDQQGVTLTVKTYAQDRTKGRPYYPISFSNFTESERVKHMMSFMPKSRIPTLDLIQLQPHSPHFVNDLGDAYYKLLLTYLAESGESVQWVYIPSKPALYKTFTVTIVITMAALSWTLGWVEIDYYTNNYYHLFVIPMLAVVAFVFTVYLFGRIDAAYVITNRSILLFGTGHCMHANTAKYIIGNPGWNHALVVPLSPTYVGSLSLKRRIGSFEGTIRIGVNSMKPMLKVPNVSLVQQYIYDVISSAPSPPPASLPSSPVI